MPDTNSDDSQNLGVDATGAEFEENTPNEDHRIIINREKRVVKPEFTGEEAAAEVVGEDDTKKQTPSKPKPALNIKPDTSAEAITQEIDAEDNSEDKELAIKENVIVNELAKAATEKKGDTSPVQAEAEKNLQNLIDNKTYNVPIGQVTKRRNTKIFLVIMILIVAAVIVAVFMVST